MLNALDGVPLEHRRVALDTTGAGGPLTLHVALAGPEDGTPVILLHGFPELWEGWRHQVPALARAGYRVIVPDQRGYAASDRPRGRRAYGVRHLARDVVALQDALCGGAPTHVVGHDWGGAVAWALAMLHPSRVRTLTVLNCPRPDVLRRCLWSNPRQLARSWYILFFQLPWVPERWLAGGAVERVFRGTAPRGTFTDDQLARYREAATVPAMRAALDWYRAALTDRAVRGPIDAPTLLIWGTGDTALGEELAAPSLEAARDGRLVRLEGVSHWVQHERPDEVTALILEHLDAHGGADPYVYKLVEADVWRAADDAWPGSEHDRRDGFVHLSAAAQVEGTLRRHFAGRGALVRLTVDPARLPAGALRWEPSRDGQRFPHLYAPLPRAAVVAEEPVRSPAAAPAPSP